MSIKENILFRASFIVYIFLGLSVYLVQIHSQKTSLEAINFVARNTRKIEIKRIEQIWSRLKFNNIKLYFENGELYGEEEIENNSIVNKYTVKGIDEKLINELLVSIVNYQLEKREPELWPIAYDYSETKIIEVYGGTSPLYIIKEGGECWKSKCEWLVSLNGEVYTSVTNEYPNTIIEYLVVRHFPMKRTGKIEANAQQQPKSN